MPYKFLFSKQRMNYTKEWRWILHTLIELASIQSISIAASKIFKASFQIDHNNILLAAFYAASIKSTGTKILWWVMEGAVNFSAQVIFWALFFTKKLPRSGFGADKTCSLFCCSRVQRENLFVHHNRASFSILHLSGSGETQQG